MLLEFGKGIEKEIEKEYEELSVKLEEALSLENELAGIVMDLEDKVKKLNKQLQKYKIKLEHISMDAERYEKILNSLNSELYYILTLLNKYVKSNDIKTIKISHNYNIIWITLFADLNNSRVDTYLITITQREDGLFNVCRWNYLNRKSTDRVLSKTQLINYLENVIKHRKTIIKNNLFSAVDRIENKGSVYV